MPNQPGPYDAVLGGAPTTPRYDMVLGGLDGVRQQLRAPDATVRAAALPKALTYGEAGLDLVIEVLRDDLQGLADEAYEVLCQRPEAKAKDAVARYDLRSECGMDYTRLHDLLKAGQWREANKETRTMMLRAVGRDSRTSIEREEYFTFPCTDLYTIDRLWVRHSQGQFGLSVQKRIYVETGNSLDHQFHWATRRSPVRCKWEFEERVGWRKDGVYLRYRDLKANPDFSPAGEFPYLSLGCGVVGASVLARGSECLFYLAQRLVNCSR